MLDKAGSLCHTTGNQPGVRPVPRPRNPHLRADWKLSLPAPTAAQADLLLEDPMTQKPKYGSRSRLVDALLQRWFAELRGDPLPPIPSLADLRSAE